MSNTLAGLQLLDLPHGRRNPGHRTRPHQKFHGENTAYPYRSFWVIAGHFKMLPKKLRLPFAGNKNSYGAKSSAAPHSPLRIFSSPDFSLKVFQNEIGVNRFGIIIPKAAVRNSVRRHFWRRRISERFRSWPDMSKDFLFISGHAMKDADEKIIRSELDKILKRLTM